MVATRPHSTNLSESAGLLDVEEEVGEAGRSAEEGDSGAGGFVSEESNSAEILGFGGTGGGFLAGAGGTACGSESGRRLVSA